MIRSGRPARVDTDIENPAVIVLKEINEGKDILEDFPSEASPHDKIETESEIHMVYTVEEESLKSSLPEPVVEEV